MVNSDVGLNLMDTSWITLATGLVAGLGIGSVITAQIQHALKLKETAHQSQASIRSAIQNTSFKLSFQLG